LSIGEVLHLLFLGAKFNAMKGQNRVIGLVYFFLWLARVLAAENEIEQSKPIKLPDKTPSAAGEEIVHVATDSSTNNAPANPDPERLVWIEPGTFIMGSPGTEKDRYSDEGPQTHVRIESGFWMGKYEVTQEQYESVMGNNPSYFLGNPKRPVEQVSWEDATNYCGKLTHRERSAGRLPAGHSYRLPTEAEWEYACRAGTTARFAFGDDLDYEILKRYAWYWETSTAIKPAGVYFESTGRYHTTHPVGQRRSNVWGLYDMHGNVWEWCLDWYSDALSGGSVTDPRGPLKGLHRVYRGGSWYDYGWYCRSSARYVSAPEEGDYDIGFRIVLAIN
jgi:formylglycine-generating enzyme required for sulfatase activity